MQNPPTEAQARFFASSSIASTHFESSVDVGVWRLYDEGLYREMYQNYYLDLMAQVVDICANTTSRQHSRDQAEEKAERWAEKFTDDFVRRCVDHVRQNVDGEDIETNSNTTREDIYRYKELAGRR